MSEDTPCGCLVVLGILCTLCFVGIMAAVLGW